jgi:hypothetical protein
MVVGEKSSPLALRDWLGLAVIVGGGLIAWGTLTADFRALAQRVDKGEMRSAEDLKALNALTGSVIELRGESKAMRTGQDRQGRQLDRIEGLLLGEVAPSQRQKFMNEPPPVQLPLRIP